MKLKREGFMKTRNTQTKNKILAQSWVVLSLMALLSSGCGKTEFKTGFNTNEATAPGVYQIPAKVDILLAMDDSGSMYGAYDAVKTQMPQLLSDLESRGWDYHFATIPLTTIRTLNQVMVSKYDSNWYRVNPSAWKAPYPNAQAQDAGGIRSDLFRSLNGDYGTSQYTAYLAGPTTIANAQEYGFWNIWNALAPPMIDPVSKKNYGGSYDVTMGLIREDAIQVVMVIGNGNDTSDVKYCTYGGGAVPYTAPCELLGQPGTDASSFNIYTDRFSQLKNGEAGKFRFYSAVAEADYLNNECRPYGSSGFNTKVGTRYIKMAQTFGGNSNVNLCQSNSIQSLVSKISTSLAGTQMTMRRRIHVLPEEPKLSSIKVWKQTAAGIVSVPQVSGANADGWRYLGPGKKTEYSIEADTPSGTIYLNQVTGYLIEYVGAAKLTGSETDKVEYQPGP